jgi:hypothetical protein
MAQITFFVGTRWRRLLNALLFSFVWRKLPKLIFRYGTNYIYIFFFFEGDCFWRKLHTLELLPRSDKNITL